MEELFVGEGVEEGFEVGALLRGECEAGDELGLVGVVLAAAGVVIEDGVEIAKAAVVHVRGADGDVAQAGWAEFSDVGRVVGVVVEAEVVFGVEVRGFAGDGQVVEAVVLEFDAVGAVGGLKHCLAAEGESAVAAGAGVGLVEEDVFAAFG